MARKPPTVKYHPLEIRVRRTIREHKMLIPGDAVLVAVSGGADSIALLHCLKRLAPEYGLILTVAHLNHQIRGEAADEDEDFVRRTSLETGFPFIAETIDVKALADTHRRNLEELARGIRYDFLRRVAARSGAQRIAVGHNQNDQAETALFRLIRGSGLRGLSSIRPVVEGVIVRPLLDCPRTLIAEYLEENGIAFREDASNRDMRYARNRLRCEVIPYLREHFNPRLVSTLAQEARLIREAWEYVESQAETAFQSIRIASPDGVSLPISGLRRLHPALQKEVLRRALEEGLGSILGIGSAHIEGILTLLAGNGAGNKIPLPNGSVAVRQFNTLTLMRQSPPEVHAYAYPLQLPGECLIRETGLRFRATLAPPPGAEALRADNRIEAFLDPETAPRTLTVRSRRPGDRYGNPNRKVKKMLIDARVPRLQRDSIPMIASENHVIWIPGFAPASEHRVCPGAASCIRVEMIRTDSAASHG